MTELAVLTILAFFFVMSGRMFSVRRNGAKAF